MNYASNYNDEDNFENVKGYTDSINIDQYMKYPKLTNSTFAYKYLPKNKSISNGNLDKNNLSLKNKNNCLVYKSVFQDIDNNTSNISNNISKNKGEYTTQNYNNKKKYFNYNLNLNLNKKGKELNNNYLSNNSNKKILNHSINKFDSNNNFNNLNKNKYSIKLNNKSVNRNLYPKKDEFFSSSDSFFKNQYDNNNNDNFEINQNSKNNNINGLIMDKDEFFKNIKEIQDLDSIDVDSTNFAFDDSNSKIFTKDVNLLLKENNNEKDNFNQEKSRSSLKVYNMTSNAKTNENKILSEKKDGNNLNYNRISLKYKTNDNVMKPKISSEKKQNMKFSKKISEKIIPNLTDNKRNNYLHNINLQDSFTKNNNFKKENLKNFYNYEIDDNNFDISQNFNTFNDLKYNNNPNAEKKFSEKLNISPYNKKRFSTLSNNNDLEADNDKNKDDINIDINSKNSKDKIDKKNYQEIYNELMDTKNRNNFYKSRIIFLTKEVKKRDMIIKKLNSENYKNQKIINKLINDNQIKLNMNKNLVMHNEKLKNEIYFLKNRDEQNINLNLIDNKAYKNNNYELNKIIKDLKERILYYKMENNKLKLLLTKSNENQYNDNAYMGRKFKNSFTNYKEKNKYIFNYREYNKSVSVSKIKKKINIDIPISKSYEEDKDIKSVDEKDINMKIINCNKII